MKPLPVDHAHPRHTNIRSLLVYGSKESAEYIDDIYLPLFKNGEIVIHENMGHMDVGALQPEASWHLEKMFFLEGIVDTSKFQQTEAVPYNFIPEQTFQDIAKLMI